MPYFSFNSNIVRLVLKALKEVGGFNERFNSNIVRLVRVSRPAGKNGNIHSFNSNIVRLVQDF